MERSSLSPADFVAMVKRENPDLAAVIAACKEYFPGCSVSFVRHHDQFIGTPLGDDSCFPAVPSPRFLLDQDRAARKRQATRGRR